MVDIQAFDGLLHNFKSYRISFKCSAVLLCFFDKWLSGKLLEEQSSIDCFKCDWAFSNTEIYLHLELASELELDLQGLVYEMEC